jgi:hypothetical protein
MANQTSVRLESADTLTIASGVVTVDQSIHIIAAEAGTTDDLDTITLDYPQITVASTTYRPLLLITADTGDTITLKNGTGNIACSTNKDIALDDEMYALLVYNGTNWVNVNTVPQAQAYTPTNVTPDRSYDADTVLVAELADVVGTLIADLQAAGLIG